MEEDILQDTLAVSELDQPVNLTKNEGLKEETKVISSILVPQKTENSKQDGINSSNLHPTQIPLSNGSTKDTSTVTLSAPEVKIPGRRGRRKKIYDKNEDPETLKEKKKKRAVELKLKNLRWTLNQETDVSGKRQKKAPQRFELVPVDKRKSCMDNCEGRGEPLGSINWVHQQLQTASIYTLRLLHRTIYRKQGMFSEKHIKRSVVKFSGFPFDGTHSEIRKRREQLERANVGALGSLCDLLALRRASKDVMIDRIIGFLLFPTNDSVENFLQEVMAEKLQQSKNILAKAVACSPVMQMSQRQESLQFLLSQTNQECVPDVINVLSDEPAESLSYGVDIAAPWKKPAYFVEGTGVKLKFIRAVAANVQVATEAFIELLHRLLYMNADEKQSMRRNILEFSGLRCEPGTTNYIYRMRILAALPMEQVKLICRVLCLPTWHRSRQLLIEGVMDFLVVPRISVMKKRVPPHFTDEISFSFDSVKVPKVVMPELKSDEFEEIEIVPDIHIPDESTPHLDSDMIVENEYLGVKLKNFSNVHYQVISTPAAKLNDVHMILYLTTSAQNNIRRNILEFSGYPFDESSKEYLCRRNLMEQMSVEDLKTVAVVLCVSQYIADDSKDNLIDAILKFLIKPSALLNSSTIMPTISPGPVSRRPSVVKKKPITHQLNEILPEIVISEVKTLSDTDEPTTQSCVNNNAHSFTPSKESKMSTDPEIERMKAALPQSNDIEIRPLSVPPTASKIKKEKKESKESVTVKNEVSIVPINVPHVDTDDEDDKPLSKIIGHPKDDQLRTLVSKIVKESKLEEITMKTVIQKVFNTYPNYDLEYRKEFIKSIVRQATWENLEDSKQDFWKSFAKQLVDEELQRRLTCNRLREDVQQSIGKALGLDKSEERREICEEKLTQRKRCHVCPKSLRRKTATLCYACKQPVCGRCSVSMCSKCA